MDENVASQYSLLVGLINVIGVMNTMAVERVLCTYFFFIDSIDIYRAFSSMLEVIRHYHKFGFVIRVWPNYSVTFPFSIWPSPFDQSYRLGMNVFKIIHLFQAYSFDHFSNHHRFRAHIVTLYDSHPHHRLSIPVVLTAVGKRYSADIYS